jgi:hypothetical protein
VLIPVVALIAAVHSRNSAGLRGALEQPERLTRITTRIVAARHCSD